MRLTWQIFLYFIYFTVKFRLSFLSEHRLLRVIFKRMEMRPDAANLCLIVLCLTLDRQHHWPDNTCV